MNVSILSVLLSATLALGKARTAVAQTIGFVQVYAGSPSGSTLLQASDGDFYGTTADDGAKGCGTVLRFDPVSSATTTLYQYFVR